MRRGGDANPSPPKSTGLNAGDKLLFRVGLQSDEKVQKTLSGLNPTHKYPARIFAPLKYREHTLYQSSLI